MKQVQATTAKARFAELLHEVERGETIVITRHGKPVARWTPAVDDKRERTRRAIAEIKALRQHVKPATVDEILSWRDEGRR